MSNQSGITVSEALAQAFPRFVKSSDRAAILHIQGEACELEDTVPSQSSHDLEAEFGRVRERLGAGNGARYIVFRLPEATEEFAFIQFMPDTAPLPSKMKYASTTATIHRELGGSSTFPTTVFWTDLAEVSSKGWHEHIAHESAEAPLTAEEQSLKRTVEYEQSRGLRPVSVANQATLGISARVSDAAAFSIRSLEDGKGVVFTVGPSETIDLDTEFSLASDGGHDVVVRQFSPDSPRYGVVKIPGHGTIFAHVCPRGSSMKQRMVFASTRIAFLDYLKRELPTRIDAVIESTEPHVDLLLPALHAELASTNTASAAEATPEPAAAPTPRFRRPKPPGRR